MNSPPLTPTGPFAKRYAWLVIFFCALFLMYKYILQVSPSIITSSLMRAFHVHGAGLGSLTATFFYTYLFTQLLVGPLLDKFSPRYLMSAAITLCAIGALLFSQSQELTSASLSRSLIGIGAAFATVGYLKMASVWFEPKRFAFVAGLLATAAMLGSILGEAPLSLLVDIRGWRASLYDCGLLGLGLAVLFYIFVRDRTPPQTLTAEISATATSLKISDFLAVLKHKKNWLIMLYSGLAFAPVAVFGGLWGNPFLEEAHHLTRAQAATLTSMVFLGLALGGPILGLVSDRIRNRFAVMAFGVSLSFVALIIALFFTNLSVIYVGAALFLFGFGTGAFMLGFAFAKDINPPRLAGTVIGLINTGDAIFGAFSEPLVGKILDVFWQGKYVDGAYYFSVQDYQIALALLPVYLLLALVLVYFLSKRKVTRR